VLDSDVIIHFIKGEQLPMIHTIFPEFQIVIIDALFEEELCKYDSTKNYLNKYLKLYKENIEIIEWNPNYEMTLELTILRKKFGFGESICMVFCKFNQDVIASSNIKDITEYCNQNGITWITTMDFLWKAYTSKLLTEDACNEFIKRVLDEGSKLPVRNIKEFTPRELF